MKSVLIIAALLGSVSAHYTMDKLVIDGVESRSWQYIRENTRAEKYMPTKFINSFGTTPLDTDFRCNQGANSNAGKTQTAEVAPGSKLGFKLAYGATMKHPGPTQVYMSKAPGAAKEYMGDGDWFKVFQATTCGSTADGLDDTDWCSWDKDRIEFTIPLATPPGEYLIRSEHIGLHGAHVGEAEFYYVCAQVKITGNGNGTPGPMVKIPGVYQKSDPAVNFSIWGRKPYDPLFPGPVVWNGASGSSQPTTTRSTTTIAATTTTTTTRSSSTTTPPPPATTTTTTTTTSPPQVATTTAGNSNPQPVTTTTRPASKTTSSHVATPTSISGGVARFGQCGGAGYTGKTVCQTGNSCVKVNRQYSLCVPKCGKITGPKGRRYRPSKHH